MSAAAESVAVKQAHTPGPWHLNERHAEIHGPDEDSLADCVGGNSFSFEQNRINAAFIVRACNAHDDLLAALHDIEAYARTKLTQRDSDKFKVIRDKARAAIAKAAA